MKKKEERIKTYKSLHTKQPYADLQDYATSD